MAKEKWENGRGTAIVLAAGRGSRMHSEVPKQYLPLCGKPVLVWSLQAFQGYDGVQDIVLVTSPDDIDHCRNEIVKQYGISKVRAIVPGGAERYLSVWEGLKAVRTVSADRKAPRTACEDQETLRVMPEENARHLVWIHDGARPLINADLLRRAQNAAQQYGACVVGMPVKDTIKVTDADGFAVDTPDRRSLWQVQTPQVFTLSLVYESYRRLVEAGIDDVTDDAMVVERMADTRVRLVEGSWQNIKITTPEDLCVAEAFLRMRREMPDQCSS